MIFAPAQRASHQINFYWLLRLRWGAIAGQTVVILGVHLIMKIALPLPQLLLLVAISAASNLAAMRWSKGRAPVVGLGGALLTLDILVLTGLLYFSGGPFNPFSFLYLVYVTLSAVILSIGWTWALLGLSLLCFGGLFLRHAGIDLGQMEHSSDHVSLHLQGMWVAFAVAAGFIVYFVQRVKTALSMQEVQLAAARELTEKSERLASLATLAAGAAHELATPLSTIAVISKELQRALEKSGAKSAIADAQLIRQELHRCRKILDHMASEAGETAGESIIKLTVDDLVDDALDGLPQAHRVDVELSEAEGQIELLLPRRAMAQALRGVLKNAIEASEDQVRLSARFEADQRCTIEVQDRGQGMPEELLKRVGEPFFTTKEPGMGMGLGLFLTRSLLERLGGRLTLDSAPGKGTTVHLHLPSALRQSVALDKLQRLE